MSLYPYTINLYGPLHMGFKLTFFFFCYYKQCMNVSLCTCAGVFQGIYLGVEMTIIIYLCQVIYITFWRASVNRDYHHNTLDWKSFF